MLMKSVERKDKSPINSAEQRAADTMAESSEKKKNVNFPGKETEILDWLNNHIFLNFTPNNH